MDTIEHVRSFIRGHHIMVLASCNKDQPYACTVFYVTNDSKTLYFKSATKAMHSNNILTNNKISLAIYDKESSPFGDKQGIQALGTATRITNPEEASQAVETYINAFNSPREKFYPIENLTKKEAESSMYKIDINKVKMLDSVNNIKPEEYLDI